MTSRDEKLRAVSGLCRAIETFLVAFLVPVPDSNDGLCDDRACDACGPETDAAAYAVGERLKHRREGWGAEITEVDPDAQRPVALYIVRDGADPYKGADCGWYSLRLVAELFIRDPHEARAAAPAAMETPVFRVGMSYDEFDAIPLGCNGENPACTDCTPCAECAFHEAALCACGHPGTSHISATLCEDCPDGRCPGFSLASWRGGPPPPEPAAMAGEAAPQPPALTDPLEQTTPADPQENCPAEPPKEVSCSSVDRVATPKPRRVFYDPTVSGIRPGRPPQTPWHETAEGKAAIGNVRASVAPPFTPPWTKGALRRAAGLSSGDTKRALTYLVEAGELVTKGGIFGPPGFTAWPTKEKKASPAQNGSSPSSEPVREDDDTDDPIGRSCAQVDLQMGDEPREAVQP